MLKHKHIFKYEVSESDIEEVTPHVIQLEIGGEVSLPEMLARIESYLRAVGYVPQENTHLDFVSID